MIRHSTSGLKLGQLLIHLVVAVLQLSLPQLHTVHVLCKGADLCLVLEMAETSLSGAEKTARIKHWGAASGGKNRNEFPD